VFRGGGGEQPSLKGASGVCTIYKSRAHVKRRQHKKRAQFGARRRLMYSNTPPRCEPSRKTKRKSVHQNTPIPLDKVRWRIRGKDLVRRSANISGGGVVEHDPTIPNQFPRIVVLYVDRSWNTGFFQRAMVPDCRHCRPLDLAQRHLDPSRNPLSTPIPLTLGSNGCWDTLLRSFLSFRLYHVYDACSQW